MLFTFAIATAVAATPAPEVKQPAGGIYVNARYGTRASFPGGMFGNRRESDNGDGATFTARDGATLLIYGAYNLEGQDPRAYLAGRVREERGAVSYRHAGRDFAVMSGTSGGRIFYQRFEFDDRRDIVHSYRLEYPRALQRRYGPVVRRISIRHDR